MIRPGQQGGLICLNDRFFDPTNDYGDEFSVFRAKIGADGKLGAAQLEPDKWHDVTLKWNLAQSTCQLLVDGQAAGKLKIVNQTINGISYVRFRSTAAKVDKGGFSDRQRQSGHRRSIRPLLAAGRIKLSTSGAT